MTAQPILMNITWGGRSGNWFALLDPASDDATIRRFCEEAVRGGEVNGVSSSLPEGAFANFVVDRFDGRQVDQQMRFIVRPRVPFG